MQVNISNFKNILDSEVKYIQDEFLKRYLINLRKMDDSESKKIRDFFSQIIESICVGNLHESYNVRISSLSDIYEKNIINYYKAHLDWLNDLAKSVEERNSKTFPQTNHTLCTFGKWLIESGKNLIQNNSKYNNLLKMHETLHFMSKQMKDLIKENDKNHIILTYLEKCEMLSLSLGTELALIDNTLIISNATKDPLTGALNRQKIEQLYHNQLEISLATSEPFALVMCDLDFFKNVNDTYGHVAGDKMLQNFVPIAKKSLRSSDMIIRYGGEEFVLILPAIKMNKAKDILNKIRIDFDNYILEYEGKKISTTLSMGVIEIDPENCDGFFKKFEDAISIVDKKLYKAKEEGRNRVY